MEFFSIFSPLCVSMLIEKSDAKCDFETHDASTSHDSDHHRVKILDTILEEKRRRQIDEDSFPEIKKTPSEKIKYNIHEMKNISWVFAFQKYTANFEAFH